jgi:hypothetical protein
MPRCAHLPCVRDEDCRICNSRQPSRSSSRICCRLGRGSRDVEPLIDAWIDWCWCLVLALGNVELAWIDTVLAVRDGDVGAAKAC